MYISNRHCPVSAKSAGVRIIGDDGSATIITFLRVELLIGAGVAPAGQALKVSTFMLGHDGESPYLAKIIKFRSLCKPMFILLAKSTV